MASKQEKDKLRALNLLGQTLEVAVGGTKHTGEVFYFSEKVLILLQGKEYVFLNINKYEELQISCLPSSQDTSNLKEELAAEGAKASDILAYILD
jgi:hypothetical protein